MRAVKDILQDINDVAGVLGCFVADGSGMVVASSLPGVFDQDSLTTVSKTISKTVEGLRMARKRKVSELDLVFDSGRLVIKVLSPGFLYVLCVPAMNVSLLNLTANVASKKLSAQLSAVKGAASAAPAAPAGPAAATPAAPAAAPKPAPANELVPRLEAIISEAMGGDGLELFREELQGFGLGKNPPLAALDELAQALYFPAALAIGGGAAKRMVDEMRGAIARG